MSLRNWNDLVREDYPEMGPVTEETIEKIEQNRHRFRGGMRISTGRIWKDDEYEKRRRKVLNTQLP